MCLRVLGYAHEIESKGTWPTNYMSKAQDLKLTRDIEFKSYNDGATRGNTAVLVWNMLRTPMWEIGSESEGDGLVSAPNREMINVKFSDYHYEENALYRFFKIDEDSKNEKPVVHLFLNIPGYEDVVEFAYEENDFYTFVPGTEVELLVKNEKKEEDKILSIVPAEDRKLVEGTPADLEDADYNIANVSGETDYLYGSIQNKRVHDMTQLFVEGSTYVYEREEKDNKYVKLNGDRCNYDDYDTTLIIKDGERISIADVEEGDVVTSVTAYCNDELAGTFVMVGSETVEGTLKTVVKEDLELTLDGVDYVVDKKATYVEDPEDEDEEQDNLFLSNLSDDMRKEEVTLYLDFLGRVVRVEFDGCIGDDADTNFGFYALASYVDYASRIYSIELENEKGSETFDFADEAETRTIAKNLYNSDEDYKGRFAQVEFNKDKEIVNITDIVYLSGDEKLPATLPTMEDDFAGELLESATFDADDQIITVADAKYMDVADDVVVVTLTWDDDDEKVTYTFGDIDALDGVKKDPMLVIWNTEDDFTEISYIVLFDNVSSLGDTFGIVNKARINDIGKLELTLIDSDDEKVVYVVEDTNYELADFAEGGIVAIKFSSEEDDDDMVIDEILSCLVAEQLLVDEDGHAVVTAVSGKKVKLDNGDQWTIGSSDFNDIYEDFTFVVLSVEEADDFEISGQYEADSFEAFSADEISLKVNDRLSVDTAAETVLVIRGMDERN